MILKAFNFTQELTQLLDPNSIPDKGSNGLLITNEGTLKKVATAVTPDLATIEEAVRLGVNALITHHGLGLDPYPLLDITSYKKMKLLLQHNIALLRYHLPLDVHQELGNNWKAARDLGWQNLESFGVYNNSFIGVRGTFPSIIFTDFVSKLELYYGNKATTIQIKDKISSAALISGGAYKFIDQAVKVGVDCFITGTFDEPTWYTAHEDKISFCALGHAATEKVGPKALAEYIQKIYGIEAIFIDTKNPF